MLLRLALLFFVLTTTGSARAQDLVFPELTGRVVDEAEVLSASQERTLTDWLTRHEDDTTNQVVVVTLPSLQGLEIEDYGYLLGRHWGIGQAEHDNGVLLIVAPEERKVRIEVGYGLEGALTDAESRIIIDRYLLPAFRAGNYGAGIEDAVPVILAEIGDEAFEKMTDASSSSSTAKMIIIVALMLLVLGVVAFTFVQGFFDPRGPFGSGGAGKTRFSRMRRDYGGFSSSGGGFGGGFSGGGGSFGGGGASGSW